MLNQTLAKAKRFTAPAILIVEFPNLSVRDETEESLQQLLNNDDELVAIDLRKDIDLLENIKALNENQIGGIYGLHAQPEVVTRLNWAREVLTDNKKRLIFWLSTTEMIDLVKRAPDFWAFRNRHLVLTINKGEISGESIYYNTSLNISRLPISVKLDRAEALEELLATSAKPQSLRSQNLRDSLALLYLEVGNYPKAIEHYTRALNIAREIGDRQGEGSILDNLGTNYRNMGEIQKAVECHEQSLQIAFELNDKLSQSGRLGNLGNTYHSLGKVKKAIEYYNHALTIARELNDKRTEGNHLGSLGLAYNDLGKTRKAIEYYNHALTIARELNDRKGESIHLGNLGNTYNASGNIQKALECYNLSLKIARDIGDKQGEGIRLSSIGIAHFNLGEVDEAIKYHKKALDNAITIHYKRGEGVRLNNLGNDYKAKGETLKAISCFLVAFYLLQSIQSPDTSYSLNMLSDIRSQNITFNSLVKSLIPLGDTILFEATDQDYVFFKDAPVDLPEQFFQILDSHMLQTQS